MPLMLIFFADYAAQSMPRISRAARGTRAAAARAHAVPARAMRRGAPRRGAAFDYFDFSPLPIRFSSIFAAAICHFHYYCFAFSPPDYAFAIFIDFRYCHAILIRHAAIFLRRITQRFRCQRRRHISFSTLFAAFARHYAAAACLIDISPFSFSLLPMMMPFNCYAMLFAPLPLRYTLLMLPRH